MSDKTQLEMLADFGDYAMELGTLLRPALEKLCDPAIVPDDVRMSLHVEFFRSGANLLITKLEASKAE